MHYWGAQSTRYTRSREGGKDEYEEVPAPARTETEGIYVTGDIQLLESIRRRPNQEKKTSWKDYFIEIHINLKTSMNWA